MKRLREKTGLFVAALSVVLMAAFSALAGMVALDEDVLSDTRAQTGVTIDLPAARATATAVFVRDNNGATGTYNRLGNPSVSNPGFFILDNVRLTDTAGTGNIGLYGFSMDGGRAGTTSMVAIGIPSIVGRIDYGTVRIGNAGGIEYGAVDAYGHTTGTDPYNNPQGGAPAFGLYIQNVSVDAGSAIWVWGHPAP